MKHYMPFYAPSEKVGYIKRDSVDMLYLLKKKIKQTLIPKSLNCRLSENTKVRWFLFKKMDMVINKIHFNRFG